MILYPQLSHAVAEQLASTRRVLRVQEAAALIALDNDDATFTPTGGSRADRQQLGHIRATLLEAATAVGYPTEPDETSRLAFDTAAAEVLHQTMQLEPSEASKPGIWAFCSCVLLCD